MTDREPANDEELGEAVIAVQDEELGEAVTVHAQSDDPDAPGYVPDDSDGNEQQASSDANMAGQADIVASVFPPEIRLIRWVGEAPRWKKVRDRKTRRIREVIDEDFERNRDAPGYENTSTKSMRPAHVPGMSRAYHWGPKKPHLAELLTSDWELLAATPAARLFVDVTDEYTTDETGATVHKYEGRPRRRLEDPLNPKTLNMLKVLGVRD